MAAEATSAPVSLLMTFTWMSPAASAELGTETVKLVEAAPPSLVMLAGVL